MSIIAASSNKSSRVLFDATRRHPAPASFGRGLLPYVPSDGRKPYTQADLDWAAHVLNAEATDFEVEPDWDELAADAYATDAASLGLLSPDMGEFLASTSLVGHDDDVSPDDIIHRGSDPRWCGCLSCVDLRTRQYAR